MTPFSHRRHDFCPLEAGERGTTHTGIEKERAQPIIYKGVADERENVYPDSLCG
jgi:hypothetical protein